MLWSYSSMVRVSAEVLQGNLGEDAHMFKAWGSASRVRGMRFRLGVTG